MKTCSSCKHLIRDRHVCNRIVFYGDKLSDDPASVSDCEDYGAALDIHDPERFGCLLHEPGEPEDA